MHILSAPNLQCAEAAVRLARRTVDVVVLDETPTVTEDVHAALVPVVDLVLPGSERGGVQKHVFVASTKASSNCARVKKFVTDMVQRPHTPKLPWLHCTTLHTHTHFWSLFTRGCLFDKPPLLFLATQANRKGLDNLSQFVVSPDDLMVESLLKFSPQIHLVSLHQPQWIINTPRQSPVPLLPTHTCLPHPRARLSPHLMVGSLLLVTHTPAKLLEWMRLSMNWPRPCSCT